MQCAQKGSAILARKGFSASDPDFFHAQAGCDFGQTQKFFITKNIFVAYVRLHGRMAIGAFEIAAVSYGKTQIASCSAQAVGKVKIGLFVAHAL